MISSCSKMHPATNAEDIVDLTVEYQEVQEVRSLGGRGATALPIDPVAHPCRFQQEWFRAHC